MAKQTKNQGDERLENVEGALSKTELWIENHQKLLWICLGGMLVIALSIWGFTHYRKKQNEKAQNLSYKPQTEFEEKALKANDFATYYAENQDYATALNGNGETAGFLKIVDDYGRTKAGKLAAYYAGLCYIKQGEYQKAIEYLKKYTNKDKVLSSMALGLIGDCYLELGDSKNAIEYYEKAVEKKPNEYTTPTHLIKLGMAYEISGDNAKALETYKTLKKEYPGSNEALDINKNIAYLQQKMK